jgi:hypothetical protein
MLVKMPILKSKLEKMEPLKTFVKVPEEVQTLTNSYIKVETSLFIKTPKS